MPDVFKILKDLEVQAVGLDPETNKMQEGYFVAFRNVGLPIHKDDFDNPWSPLGLNLDKAVQQAAPSDPANAPKTASGTLTENKVAVANIAKSQQAYLNAFMLTDKKLRLNHQYQVMPSASSVSDSVWAILTGANGIPVESELNPEMKAAYDRARAKLMDADGNPTPQYQAYLAYQDRYREKLRAWRRAYAAAFTDPMKLQHWPIEGTTYHEDADSAWDQWVALGFKEPIENAIATLAAAGTDPAIALIARSKKRFVNSLNEFQSIGQIPYTMMQPASWYDPDGDGWNQYSSHAFHHESHYQASSTSYGGGGGFHIGLWSAAGGFDHAEEQQSLGIQTNDLEVSFSYSVVDIERPWYPGSLLHLRNWFLMGDYKKGCISDGTMSQEKPENLALEPTFLPSVVTSLILVKDLSIRWRNWKSDWEAASSRTSAGAAIGYGPFALTGRYSHHDEQRDFTADAEGESLMARGIQVVGYASTINPHSPGVDSSEFLEHG